MRHEGNLMESQATVSDPEGFSRFGGINYSHMEDLPKRAERLVRICRLLLKRCLFKYVEQKQEATATMWRRGSCHRIRWRVVERRVKYSSRGLFLQAWCTQSALFHNKTNNALSVAVFFRFFFKKHDTLKSKKN